MVAAVLLVVMIGAAVIELLVRGAARSGPWHLMIFAQGSTSSAGS